MGNVQEKGTKTFDKIYWFPIFPKQKGGVKLLYET